MPTKREVLRMCVLTREMKAQRELIRFALGADGILRLDRGGKLPGRGAYLTADVCLFPEMRKRRVLERMAVSGGQDFASLYEELRCLLAEKAEAEGSLSAQKDLSVSGEGGASSASGHPVFLDQENTENTANPTESGRAFSEARAAREGREKTVRRPNVKRIRTREEEWQELGLRRRGKTNG